MYSFVLSSCILYLKRIGVNHMSKKLTRSRNDRALQGVCGGIAEYFGISSFGIRLIFLFLPANLLIYIILANIMPVSPESL